VWWTPAGEDALAASLLGLNNDGNTVEGIRYLP
jgi:Na+-transporting NADH:ubiquinone oxidoreductase subunit NqrC